jgi:lysophospholipase L1-like esterase
MKKLFLPFCLLLMAFGLQQQKRKITILLAGDSTMAIKERKAFPETGWGMPFAFFFDSTVTVDNRAKNGRSTRTFISEGLWQQLIDDLKAGDYVLIQFGHNDEAKEKTDRYASPDEYRANLTRFVEETRKKGGHPILISPVSRRRFDSSGNAIETHAAYTPLVKETAEALKVPYIDLDAKSRAFFQQFGKENSKWLFLQLAPGEHPNYPNGRNDNTHFNELGARLVAQLVLADLRALEPELNARVVVSQIK